MYYIVKGVPCITITHGPYQETVVKRDEAIDFESIGGPRPVNYPEYFKEATNVDKLLIMGKKIPCTKIHGSIHQIQIHHIGNPKLFNTFKMYH